MVEIDAKVTIYQFFFKMLHFHVVFSFYKNLVRKLFCCFDYTGLHPFSLSQSLLKILDALS